MLPQKDRIYLARNLSELLKAGIQIDEAINFIKEKTPTPTTKKILSVLQKKVEAGAPLWQAAQSIPHGFDPLFIHFVRTGEQSGNLAETLTSIAEHYERVKEMKQGITAALAYPIIILGVVVAYGAGFSFFIFPRLEILFGSFNAQLPPLTQALVATAQWIQQFGLMTLGVLIAMSIALWMLSKTPKGTLIREHVIRAIPGIGSLVTASWYARMWYVLHLLQKSGTPLVETLAVAAEVSDSQMLAIALRHSREKISQGDSLSQAFSETKACNDLAIRLIGIGETTGRLQETYAYLAELHKKEVSQKTKNLTSSLGPIILILVGICVALLAIAIILPIYGSIGSLRPF